MFSYQCLLISSRVRKKPLFLKLYLKNWSDCNRKILSLDVTNTLPTKWSFSYSSVCNFLFFFSSSYKCGKSGRITSTLWILEGAHHDVFVNEASPIPSWFQMWIFFSAGDFNIPNLLPGLVKLNVDRVDTRMVRGHCIAHVSRNAVLLRPNKLIRMCEDLSWSYFHPRILKCVINTIV